MVRLAVTARAAAPRRGTTLRLSTRSAIAATTLNPEAGERLVATMTATLMALYPHAESPAID